MSVCRKISKYKDIMRDLIEKSYKEAREYAFAINNGHGRITAGSISRVGLIRYNNTIGSFHTHPYGVPIPSKLDLSVVKKYGDEFMCIGVKENGKPVVYCYDFKRKSTCKLNV